MASDLEVAIGLAAFVVIFGGAAALLFVQIRRAIRQSRRDNLPPPAPAPRGCGFPVKALPVEPVTAANDGPGRYRVVGVIKETGVDVKIHVEAVTMANAKVKAELKGVIVTAIEKEYASVPE